MFQKLKRWYVLAKYCPSCGRSMPEDGNVCPYCGKAVAKHEGIMISSPQGEKKKDNKGLIIAVVVIFLLIVPIAIAATVYVYVSGMVGPEMSDYSTTPDIAFALDNSNNKIKIISGSTSDRYADYDLSPNIIFKNSADAYYVNSDYELTENMYDDLCTSYIFVGDEITGFSEGTWSIIWNPTNRIIGVVTFT